MKILKKIGILIMLVNCLYLTAEIIEVPEDHGTIQIAIDIAINGDTILVAPGTYFENINFNGKNIVVTSHYLTTQDTIYIDQTVIDGDNPVNPEEASVVTFENYEDNTAILTGFTLINGAGTYMQPYDILPDYWVYAGGGIYCYNASPQLMNLKIIENSTEGWGGGIFLRDSNSKLENIKVFNNTASNAGGIMNWVNANTEMTSIMIKYNHSNGYTAGGIEIIESNPIIINAQIMHNSCPSNGGGCYIADASPIIENSIISFNSASLAGGISLWNWGGEDNCPTFRNVLISNNTAYESGAGIFYEGDLHSKFINTTVVNNVAGDNGGGIFCRNFANFTNSIIWGNVPDQIWSWGVPDSIDITYTDIQDGWFGEGNIDLDPLFADDINFDYRLLENSPGINAGNPDTTGLELPFFDLGGNPRFVGNRIDMGVYEYQNVAVQNENMILDSGLGYLWNYPNPFYPVTTISYQIAEETPVKIEIYNIRGQNIRTFLDENKAVGLHNVLWDGKDQNNNPVSSGVYFYQIETNSYQKTMKMLLLE